MKEWVELSKEHVNAWVALDALMPETLKRFQKCAEEGSASALEVLRRRAEKEKAA